MKFSLLTFVWALSASVVSISLALPISGPASEHETHKSIQHSAAISGPKNPEVYARARETKFFEDVDGALEKEKKKVAEEKAKKLIPTRSKFTNAKRVNPRKA